MQTTITNDFLQEIKTRIQKGDKNIRTELRKELVAAGYNNSEVNAIFAHPIVQGTRYGTAIRITFEDGFTVEDTTEDQKEDDAVENDVQSDENTQEVVEEDEDEISLDTTNMWA